MLNPVKLVVAISLIVLVTGIASSQDYPTKPIRIYTGSAGSGNDVAARVIAQGITASLGQPVIVENRGGTLPEQTVYKAAPDGYSLLYAGRDIGLAPLLEPTGFDVVKDFSPVTMTTRSPYLLNVHPSLPVKSVKELIALARSKPGQLNYGSGSPASSTHLAGELFKSMAGINIYNIPFKSGGSATMGLMVGEVQIMFNSTGTAMPYIKSGKLRSLAVTSLEPSVLVPGLPTVTASGLPGYEYVGFDAVFAPGKTPAAIVNQLNREIVRVLDQSAVKDKFLGTGQEVITSSPEELGNKMKSEVGKWGKLMREIGIIKSK